MPPPAARPSARFRFLVALATLAILLLGFLALGRLPVDLLPARHAPHLRVQLSVPGLTAPEIDQKITQPLEAALTGATGVTAVESVTAPGRVTVNLYLTHQRVVDATLQDVAARLDHVKATWPASIDAPVVSVVNTSSEVMEFALTSRRHDMLALRDWAENELAGRLRELPGVATVGVEGGAVREILVTPDQRRLAGYGLSFNAVLQAIRKTPEADAGTHTPALKGRARRGLIQSGNAAAVAVMPVTLPSGESIPLAEVAGITLSHEVKAGTFRYDGEEAVRISVRERPAAAMSDVVERVHAQIEWMRANRLIPADVEIHPLTRRLEEARHSLRQMAFALIGGVALVLLTAHLLWGEGRRTLILGVIIAASFQAIFIALALANLPLDGMSFGGAVAGTGLFGGCAILLFENLGQGPPGNATLLRFAAMAIVAVSTALVPVLFAGGEIGALFQEFIQVFSGAWLLSVLLALVLVPAFDARTRRHEREMWNALISHGLARARQLYGRLLHYILRRPVVVLLPALLFTGAMTAVFLLGNQQPPLPDNRFTGEIVLRLQGPDAARLAALGDGIAQRLRAIPDLGAVKNSARASQEELVLHMDEDRARTLGVDIVDAGKALAIATTGIPAGSFRDAEHRYDIRMQLPPQDSASDAALGKTLLLGELSDRPAVRLSDVATVERVDVPDRILRYDGMPMIELRATPANGDVSPRTMARLHDIFDHYSLPAGYRMFYGGPGQATAGSQGQGLKSLGWALLLAFVLLTLLHRSLLMAALATFTAFSALAGLGAVVFFFDIPMSSSVWIGALIVLAVAVVQASVLAMQTAAQAEPGATLRATLEQTAKHQFRPLLAVTLMAQLGMLPLMWFHGSAAVLRPLVMTCATGLLFSLMASLLLMPPMYFVARRMEQSSSEKRL